jgi:16S rRNA processing protein RimM
MRERVRLGVVGAAHGVAGEVRVKSFTADPISIARYRPLETEDGRAIEIVSARVAKGDMLIVRIRGVTDRNGAQGLANRALFAPREALGDAEEDEFFHADLIGLMAETEQGETIGRVVAIHDFGAGDIIEIAPDGGGPSRLLPFTRAVVPQIDIEGGRLVVVPPEESEGEGERHE